MNDRPPLPTLEKVKQWAAKVEKINERWDALIVIADYMIAELEADIREQRPHRYKLEKAMRLLNMNPELLEKSKICQQSEKTIIQ